MGNGIFLLMVIEKALRLRFEHPVDKAGEPLLIFIQRAQAEGHLFGSEEVVLIIFRVDSVGVFAHVLAYGAAVVVVSADLIDEQLRLAVAGADDAALKDIGILHAADLRVPVHFAVIYLLGKIHVQRHLIHAACHHVLPALVEMLLAGDKVAVAEGYRAGLVAVLIFIEEVRDDLVPVPVVLHRGGKRGRTQHLRQAQRREKTGNEIFYFHVL